MPPKKTPATSASPPKAAGSPKPAAAAAKSAPKAGGASKAVHDYSGIRKVEIHKRVTAIVEKHDKANVSKVKPVIENSSSMLSCLWGVVVVEMVVVAKLPLLIHTLTSR